MNQAISCALKSVMYALLCASTAAIAAPSDGAVVDPGPVVLYRDSVIGPFTLNAFTFGP